MAIPAKDFQAWIKANEKLDAGQVLSADEQKLIDAYGREENTPAPVDNYFDSMSYEIDLYPIGFRGRRAFGAH